MFIDEIQLHLKAGGGGHGVVRWRHEKGRELAGAAGGNGGRGGSVYAKAIRDVGALARYRNRTHFEAERGDDGMRDSMQGKNGNDYILEVPIGTIITNKETGDTYELLKEDEQILLLKGGTGGLGNEHFKASTNTSPQEQTDGKPGEEADFFIELQLIIDAGLVGFPNAGKSSLLNVLTNAKAKIGDYAFTTLEPNLGSLYGYVIADIPGLIEGAATGRGLGHKFLKHIRRTKLIIHCISLEHEDVVAPYRTIRAELAAFNAELSRKPEIVLLTKTDLVSEDVLKAAKESLRKEASEILSVSIIDDNAVKALSEHLTKILKIK
ncbi:MAG: hypothetical protein A2928_02860 [Candidatus Taylorbacteria bacterium RIFCSPLOWO2_01_FULL_45_15b]|uniref:GTPase Obg n=1 Tax=Candidatus Taylorbacteria bacterium RIFCSPLOWO2_01_FULL_45_15b TaxID=1802319 RepID=A0A1G2NH92_9BACT|nr:MAG: hypothetical protein A2928_02860 [Candidatus Taylorbacteria bacterium RIFCSPLOWO2_01_FULL_45_15b]